MTSREIMLYDYVKLILVCKDVAELLRIFDNSIHFV